VITFLKVGIFGSRATLITN